LTAYGGHFILDLYSKPMNTPSLKLNWHHQIAIAAALFALVCAIPGSEEQARRRHVERMAALGTKVDAEYREYYVCLQRPRETRMYAGFAVAALFFITGTIASQRP
jgi:hypothetical protein